MYLVGKLNDLFSLRSFVRKLDQRSARKSGMRCHDRAELFEDRTLLAAVSDSGSNVLTIDLNVANEQLHIESQGSQYLFTSTSPFVAASGSDPEFAESAFDGFGTNELTLTSSGLTQYGEIRVLDSATGTSVIFSDSGVHNYRNDMRVLLDNSPDLTSVSFEGDTNFTDNALSVHVETGVTLNSGSHLSINDGEIYLTANLGKDSTRLHRGIELTSARITTTGSGPIELIGNGGESAGTDRLYGVSISHSSVIESTSSAPDAGTITISGTGGVGTSRNYGISISENSVIASVTGAVNADGTGGVGTSSHNYGVILWESGGFRSTGVGPDAATITVTGEGGLSTSRSTGIHANGGVIETIDGDVSLTGTSAVTTFAEDNNGIELLNSHVQSTGLGMHSATITMHGTGGNGGTNFNDGIELKGTDVSTVDGGIDLTGIGGGGTGERQLGITIQDKSVVTSSGLGANAANITIQGTGGEGTNDNFGVSVRSQGTLISSNDGLITLTGVGGNGTTNNAGIAHYDSAIIESRNGNIHLEGTGGNGTESHNRGIRTSSEPIIRSTGTGPDAATITLIGNGGEGSHGNSGLSLEKIQIESIDGDISLTGVGGTDTTGGDANGTELNVSEIRSIGQGVEAAQIIIVGIGGTGTASLEGIQLKKSRLETIDGDISLTGTGGIGTGNDQRGVAIREGSSVLSTGTGIDAGKIEILGTGGTGVSHSPGVRIDNVGTSLTSFMAPINITGIGGQGDISEGGEQQGVRVNGAAIRSFATGPNAGVITIDGTAGESSRWNDGIRLTGFGTAVKTIDADIHLTGTGYSRDGHGFQLWDQAEVAATGSGSVNITGTGGADSSGLAVGVFIGVSGSIISVNTGELNITGQGGTNDTADSSKHYGILLHRAAVIRSIGLGDDVGAITIIGTGGDGRDHNYGVYISEDNSLITTIDADIMVNGTATGDNSCLYGLRVAAGADIRSTGVGPNAGTITLIGEGRNGPDANHGIRLSEVGTEITSIDGDITLTGTANLSGHGIRITPDVLIASTGTGSEAAKITLNGMSASDGLAGAEVRIENNATLRSIDGDISVTATTISSQSEIGLDVLQATIETLGTADIYLTGTAAGFAADIGYNGKLTPSHNQATLNGDNVEFSPSTVIGLTLAGTTAGDTYGQVAASDDIILGNAELDISIDPSFSISLGEQFTIVDMQGANPASGTFAGLGEGDIFSADGKQFQITYEGGDGNDVVLTHVEPYRDIITWDDSTGYWYYGISNGTEFVQVQGPRWSTTAGWDFHHGDFNGDGRTDVAGRTSDGAWYVILSSDTGFQTEYWGSWGSNTSQQWTDVSVGDFNGDGMDDIIGRNWRGEHYVAQSSGTNFSTAYWGRIAQSGWVQGVVGDFNGDGLDDIATFRENGQWWVSESTGSAFALDYYGKYGTQASAGWHNFTVGDFNGDGLDDIVQQTSTGQLWIGDGDAAQDGRFNIHFAGYNHQGTYVESFVVGDFDGDGREDLVGNTAGLGLSVFQSVSTGRFVAQNWGQLDGLPFTVGDFNGDGRDDIVSPFAAGSGNSSMTIWHLHLSDSLGFNKQTFGEWNDHLYGVVFSGEVIL